MWDVNAAVVDLFGACATQWRILASPAGFLHLGLDYAGVDVVLRRLAPPDADAAEIFADLQAMEAAALPILNEALAR